MSFLKGADSPSQFFPEQPDPQHKQGYSGVTAAGTGLTGLDSVMALTMSSYRTYEKVKVHLFQAVSTCLF